MNEVNHKYRQARGYAFKFSPSLGGSSVYSYTDLVHDAYLVWHKKTGRNLFDEHRGVISQVVKNVWRGRLMFNSFQWDKKKYAKSYVAVTTDYVETASYIPSTQEDPEKLLIYKDLEQELHSKFTERERKLYNELVLGYSTQEIAEKQNTYRQKLDHVRRSIEHKSLELITSS